MVDWSSAAFWLSGAGLLLIAVAAEAIRRYGKVSPGIGRTLIMARNVGAVLGALSIFGIFSVASFAGIASEPASATTPARSSDVVLQGVSCPDTGLTAYSADIFSAKNKSAGERLSHTLSLYPLKDDGSLEVNARVTYATNPTETRTAATNLFCGKKYKVYSAMIRDNSSSIYESGQEFIPSGAQKIGLYYADERGGAGRSLLARCYDLEGAAFACNNASSGNGDACSVYQNVTVTCQSSTNNTALAVGVDGIQHYQVDYAAVGVSSAASPGNTWGGVETWLCIDRTPAEMDRPYVVKWNGQDLTSAEAKSQLDSYDQAQLSAFDDCYKLPIAQGISDVQGSNRLEIGVKAASGTDPTTDWSARMFARNWMIDQDGVTPRLGIFRKQDGREEYGSAIRALTFDIS